MARPADADQPLTWQKQLNALVVRLCTAGEQAGLGVTVEDLPRQLHKGCGWCHRIPAQERHRAQLRDTYRWAGVEIPADLAELAPDAPCPGDSDLAAAHLTGEWQSWPRVSSRVRAATSWPWERVSAALDALLEAGVAEERRRGPGSPDIRRRTAVQWGAAAMTDCLFDLRCVICGTEQDLSRMCEVVLGGEPTRRYYCAAPVSACVDRWYERRQAERKAAAAAASIRSEFPRVTR